MRTLRLIWPLFVAWPFAAFSDAEGAQSVARALALWQSGDGPAAATEARQAGQVGTDIIAWNRLRAGEGQSGDYRNFVARRGDWPGIALLRKMGEGAVGGEPSSRAVLDYFRGQLPQTGTGSLALAHALDGAGLSHIAADEIRRSWLSLDLTDEEFSAYLVDYGPALQGLAADHLTNQLWARQWSDARRALPLVDPDLAAMARARIALLTNEDGIDALIEAVPPVLADAPLLAHARAVWRYRAGRYDDAANLVASHSRMPDGLGRAEAWADLRLILARRLMAEGHDEAAFDLARLHGLQDGSDYAALEWLAGYVALTRLDKAEAALDHFRRFRTAVTSPISLGRAGYWEGRALEALGRPAEAQAAYEFGAEFQTSFYGQLAAEAAGIPMSDELAGAESYPDLKETALADSSVLQAALLLEDAGDGALFRRFLRHLAEFATHEEKGALADLALARGEPHAAIYIAKYAADGNDILPRPYFPVLQDLPAGLPVPKELVMAVIRRESEFDPAAVSPVGARGLMQVMPGTAALMAEEIGFDGDIEGYGRDPALNVRLGTAYLATLDEEFDGWLPAMLAAYNAGPHRARTWLEELGDPRRDLRRAVDWIEAVPFEETRNYIMRVMEAEQVYRARLAGHAVAWSLGDLVAGR